MPIIGAIRIRTPAKQNKNKKNTKDEYTNASGIYFILLLP